MSGLQAYRGQLCLSFRRRCACAFSVVLLAACVVVAQPVTAQVVVIPKIRMLGAGERLQQAIELMRIPGVRIQISLGAAPEGVNLTVNQAGQVYLDWQPGPEFAEESRIELMLSDVDSGELIEAHELLVRRADPASPEASPVDPPDSRPALPDDAVPHLAELANQVISAGFVVSLRVVASLPGASTPILQVDRLPRNASFDFNEDGSRTFYWRTGKMDEGEHVFRFTAINPKNARRRDMREVLIVVGDPSRKTVRPEEAATAIQQ